MHYNGCFFTKNPSQALSGKSGFTHSFTRSQPYCTMDEASRWPYTAPKAPRNPQIGVISMFDRVGSVFHVVKKKLGALQRSL